MPAESARNGGEDFRQVRGTGRVVEVLRRRSNRLHQGGVHPRSQADGDDVRARGLGVVGGVDRILPRVVITVGEQDHHGSDGRVCVGCQLCLSHGQAITDGRGATGNQSVNRRFHGIAILGEWIVERGSGGKGSQSHLVNIQVHQVDKGDGCGFGVNDRLAAHGTGPVNHQHHIQRLYLLWVADLRWRRLFDDGRVVQGQAIHNHACLVVHGLCRFRAVDVFHADGGAVGGCHILVLQGEGVIRAIQENLERFRRGGAAAVRHLLPLHDVQRGANLARVNLAIVAANRIQVVPQAVDGVVRGVRVGQRAVGVVREAVAEADEAVGADVHLCVRRAIQLEGEAQVYLREGVIGQGDHVCAGRRGHILPRNRNGCRQVRGYGNRLRKRR